MFDEIDVRYLKKVRGDQLMKNMAKDGLLVKAASMSGLTE